MQGKTIWNCRLLGFIIIIKTKQKSSIVHIRACQTVIYSAFLWTFYGFNNGYHVVAATTSSACSGCHARIPFRAWLPDCRLQGEVEEVEVFHLISLCRNMFYIYCLFGINNEARCGMIWCVCMYVSVCGFQADDCVSS